MKLHAICSGKTAVQNIRGHDVKTAYAKKQVAGPVKINKTGLEGNEVAVHLDAIYAVALSTYDYWAAELGVEKTAWPAGTFAENLIIDGLEEETLAVGDIIEIGDQVVLSVAGPRLPCFKLCWRLGLPDSFVPTFALSGKSGVYFNVEKTGVVNTSDPVRLRRNTNSPTLITDIARALFAGAASADEMRAMLALPGLSDIAKFALGAKISFAEDQQRVRPNRWSGTRSVVVERVVVETPEIKSIHLRAQDSEPLAAYHGGQFLAVKLPMKDGPLTRVWSLSDFQEQPDHYRLSIRKAPGGLGSVYVNDVVKSGDVLEISAPLGHFVLDRGGFKPVLLIAGGIGITPLLAMLKSHINRGSGRPPVYLIHCVRGKEFQPFRAELDELAKESGVTICHVFDHPTDEDIATGACDIKGFLNEGHIRNLIGDAHIMNGDIRIDMPPYEFDCFICGPQVFQDIARSALLNMEANAHQIHTESFASPEDGSGGVPVVQEADVVFLPTNTQAHWDAGPNPTLLELAEEAGLTPENACRIGVCHSCSHRLVEGEVYYEQSLSHPPQDGQVLLCCARPHSGRVVLES